MGALSLACVGHPSRTSESLRVNSYRLQKDRDALAGAVTTLKGYLVSVRTIGENVCLKVLVDEKLHHAPELLIANGGRAVQPSRDLKELHRRTGPGGQSESGELEREVRIEIEPVGGVEEGDNSGGAVPAQEDSVPEARPPYEPATTTNPDLVVALERVKIHFATARARPIHEASVVQACKRPPTSANEDALRNALAWLDPLKKPKRIENAPSLDSLRRELQLFYLERSRRYRWAELQWEEILLTGILLAQDADFEGEISGGVDLVPYLVGIYDGQRGRWLLIDLTFGDSVAKELMLDVLGKQVPGLIRRARRGTLAGILP